MNMSPLQRKFVIKQRIYSISVTLSRLILFLGFIGIWEFTADKGIINAFIFSSPVRLYQTFMDLAKDGVIFMHIWVNHCRICNNYSCRHYICNTVMVLQRTVGLS